MTAVEYVLLADAFYRRQPGGRRVRYRKGDTVTGLSQANADRLLRIKAIERKYAGPVDDVVGPVDESAEADDTDSAKDGEADDESTEVERPAKSAIKPLWEAYAISQGASPEEAESLTKGELIAQYGGQ